MLSLVSNLNYLGSMSSVQFILNSTNGTKIIIPHFPNTKANISIQKESFKKVLFPSYRSKTLNYIVFSIRLLLCRPEKSLAVGEYGLILCYLQKKIFRTPYIYFSDELILNKPPILKFILKKSIENSRLIISQDKIRKEFLFKTMKIDSEPPWAELPNVHFTPTNKKNSFHIFYKIPREHKIIHWSCSSKKIKQSGLLNFIKTSNLLKPESNYHLLVRFRDEKYRIPKNLLKDKNITICHNPMPFELFETYLNSVHINVISYYPFKNMGPNVNLIGKSSGQMNLSLKHGIPFIAEDLIGFHWLKKYNAGLFFKEINLIDNLIMKISSNHKFFSDNCKEAFNLEIHHTEFVIRFKNFLND